MPRLPRLVLVINAARPGPVGSATEAAGTAALTALVDGGLEVTAVIVATPGDDRPERIRQDLAQSGLSDRLTAVTGPLEVCPAPGGRPPFTLVDTGSPAGPHGAGSDLGRWDAVVLVGAPIRFTTAAGVTVGGVTVGGTLPGAGPDHPRASVGAFPEPWREGYFFGGVFHTELEGVFRVAPMPQLAAAQAGWVGEYLRGRYLLPPRSAMVDAAGFGHPAAVTAHHGALRRGAGNSYLRALARELRRGHDRAARAGYPLPVPSRLS